MKRIHTVWDYNFIFAPSSDFYYPFSKLLLDPRHRYQDLCNMREIREIRKVFTLPEKSKGKLIVFDSKAYI